MQNAESTATQYMFSFREQDPLCAFIKCLEGHQVSETTKSVSQAQQQILYKLCREIIEVSYSVRQKVSGSNLIYCWWILFCLRTRPFSHFAQRSKNYRLQKPTPGQSLVVTKLVSVFVCGFNSDGLNTNSNWAVCGVLG